MYDYNPKYRPLEGCTFLIVVNADTKWFEVRQVAHLNLAATIYVLHLLLAMFGVLWRVMSDNDTAFVSDKIQAIYEKNGVQVVTSGPCHVAMNGQAEHYVAELRKALVQDTKGTMKFCLSQFLFRQHTIIHTTTGVPPDKAMLGCELPSPLHAILPSVVDTAESQAGR